jgi:hypothetical protein
VDAGCPWCVVPDVYLRQCLLVWPSAQQGRKYRGCKNIEDVLVNRDELVTKNIVDHANRHFDAWEDLNECVSKLQDLRESVLAQEKPNLCLGEGAAAIGERRAAIKC